jgi:hypothetical protein
MNPIDFDKSSIYLNKLEPNEEVKSKIARLMTMYDKYISSIKEMDQIKRELKAKLKDIEKDLIILMKLYGFEEIAKDKMEFKIDSKKRKKAPTKKQQQKILTQFFGEKAQQYLNYLEQQTKIDVQEQLKFSKDD